MVINIPKETCQRLYEQYNELTKKTQLHIQVQGTRRVASRYIKPEDFIRKKEIRLQLLDCKEYLNLKPRELFVIEKR